MTVPVPGASPAPGPPAKSPIRVVVVDDQPLVIAGLRLLLADADGIEIVGDASDGACAVTTVQRLRPDVVLMDVRMPGVDGMTATRQLRAGVEPGDGPFVIGLTTFDDDATARAMTAAGASGFLLKHASSSELATAIRQVAAGRGWLDPSVGARLLAAWRTGTDDVDIEAALTARERELLVLVAGGSTNEDIARSLVISVATVKTHLARILVKTGARDRAGLVALAYRSGFMRRHGA